MLISCWVLSGSLFAAAVAVAGSIPAVGPGLEYLHQRIGDGPWSVHALKIDRQRDDLRLMGTLAAGTVVGLRTVSEQLEALPKSLGEPVAVINGDFFVIRPGPYQGDPQGLQIADGELVSAPSGGACFWIDTEGHPRLGEVRSKFSVTWSDGTRMPFGLNQERKEDAAVVYTARFGPETRTQGGRDLVLAGTGGVALTALRVGETFPAQINEVRDGGNAPLAANTMVLSVGPLLTNRFAAGSTGLVVQISTATAPDLHGIQLALGGGPVLIIDGQPRRWRPPQPRHPRTAIGWTETHLFFVVVDGRQSRLSVGMTFPELADYMKKLGCEEAMNLDGGGSSTLWLGGQVVNSPSDGRERRVANALILLRTEPQR